MAQNDKPETTSAMQAIPAEMAAMIRAMPVLDTPKDEIGPTQAVIPPTRQGRPIPPEGADGLFTQSWFPICLASAINVGDVQGFDFLDGRVVVWRGDDGQAHVTSAFCPHMGASLEAGDVVENQLRCAFHHWEYIHMFSRKATQNRHFGMDQKRSNNCIGKILQWSSL